MKLSQVIVGLIPAGVLGVLFEDLIDEHLFSTETVLIGLVIGAIFMIVADKVSSKRAESGHCRPNYVQTGIQRRTDSVSVALAGLLPLRLHHLRRRHARYESPRGGRLHLHYGCADHVRSQLTVAAKNWEYFTLEALPFFIAGFVAAFVFALISIRFFLKLINRIKLVPFAIYRIVLAAIIALVLYL